MAFARWRRRRLHRQLNRVHAQLADARADVAIAEEQLVAFADDADEARVRVLVTENRLDARNAQEAQRHHELMVKSLEEARRRVFQLDRLERELLAQIE